MNEWKKDASISAPLIFAIFLPGSGSICINGIVENTPLYSPKVVIAILILLSGYTVFAQQGIEEGIGLYREGRFAESISALEPIAKRDKKNPEVWNFLGLAYLKTGEPKAARKAFENAVKYSPDNLEYRGNLAVFYLSEFEYKRAEKEFDRILTSEPADGNAYLYRGIAKLGNGDFRGALEDADNAVRFAPALADGYFLKMDASLVSLAADTSGVKEESRVLSLITSAKASLTECLELCPSTSREEVERRFESLDASERYFLNKFDGENKEPDEDLSNLKVNEKPPISYNDVARQAGEQGEVRLLVEFRYDGSIGHVLPVKTLKYGLTERAVAAAKKIRFEPATMNGEPISVFRLVFYRFAIY